MYKTLTLIFILISTVVFGQTNEIYKKIGDSLIEANKIDELIKYFENEYKTNSKNENVLRWIGYGYLLNSQLDSGEVYYQLLALVHNPECSSCCIELGKLYSLNNEKEKANEYFEKAINLDNTNTQFYIYRAEHKAKIGNKLGALSDYNKAIELKPEEYNYYIKRGLFNASIGYPSIAYSDLSKAIELAPSNPEPYFYRSEIHFGNYLFDEALKDINIAIKFDTLKFDYFVGRGAIYDAMNDPKQAIVDYSKAISINSQEPKVFLKRASSYHSLQNMDSCCSDNMILKSIIEKQQIDDSVIIQNNKEFIFDLCDTTKPSYYYQRGIACYNLNDFEKSIEYYDTCLSKFSQNSMTYFFKANALLALFKYEEAVENYQMALKNSSNFRDEILINPRFKYSTNKEIDDYFNGTLSNIYYNLAYSLTNMNKYDEAFIEINNAFTIAPDIQGVIYEDFYNLRGYLYLMKGTNDSAIFDFDKCIDINNIYSIAYVNRAIAKVSIVENIKTKSPTILIGNFFLQPLVISWDIPTKSSLKKSKAVILDAINDCNLAIEQDVKLGYGYYIRGLLKQMLKQRNYCTDILTAKELGQEINTELLINCNK